MHADEYRNIFKIIINNGKSKYYRLFSGYAQTEIEPKITRAHKYIDNRRYTQTHKYHVQVFNIYER